MVLGANNKHFYNLSGAFQIDRFIIRSDTHLEIIVLPFCMEYVLLDDSDFLWWNKRPRFAVSRRIIT